MLLCGVVVVVHVVVSLVVVMSTSLCECVSVGVAVGGVAWSCDDNTALSEEVEVEVKGNFAVVVVVVVASEGVMEWEMEGRFNEKIFFPPRSVECGDE